MRNRYGDYGALYKELLQDKDKNEEWHVWYPVDDHFPTAEDLAGFKVNNGCCCSTVRSGVMCCTCQKSQNLPYLQGICVTGSKHDAYAKNEWNLKLQKLLRTCFDRQQRILGICFGCQTMVIVLGGSVGEHISSLYIKSSGHVVLH